MLITALAIMLGFGVLIGFHESSHMFASKLFGVKVNKFAIGFGPTLFSFKYGETSYELKLLPLGGYVTLHGEDPESNVERGFFSLPWYKRALIALAGPVASLLLGYLIIVGLFLVNGWPILLAFPKAYGVMSLVFVKTYQFFAGTLPPAEAGAGVSGPIMIVKLLADSLRDSVVQFLFILAVVSLSLGMFNLLPLPMLDGGHVFLYTLEGLRGKKWPVKAYVIWNTIGIALLGTLMFYTILSDIFHLVH